jgi:hypothetical protein
MVQSFFMPLLSPSLLDCPSLSFSQLIYPALGNFCFFCPAMRHPAFLRLPEWSLE